MRALEANVVDLIWGSNPGGSVWKGVARMRGRSMNVGVLFADGTPSLGEGKGKRAPLFLGRRSLLRLKNIQQESIHSGASYPIGRQNQMFMDNWATVRLPGTAFRQFDSVSDVE